MRCTQSLRSNAEAPDSTKSYSHHLEEAAKTPRVASTPGSAFSIKDQGKLETLGGAIGTEGASSTQELAKKVAEALLFELRKGSDDPFKLTLHFAFPLHPRAYAGSKLHRLDGRSTLIQIQYSGYLLVPERLFKKSATRRSTVAPNPVGTRMYKKPKSWIFGPPMTAIRAVAPPGGWRVLVICMSAMEDATAKDAPSELQPKSLKHNTPTAAQIRCPPRRFLGCAKGDLGVPYKSTAEAPKEPIRRVVPSGSKYDNERSPHSPTPKKALSQERKISSPLTRGGEWPPPFIFRTYSLSPILLL
jgi:hypothetical protein